MYILIQAHILLEEHGFFSSHNKRNSTLLPFIFHPTLIKKKRLRMTVVEFRPIDGFL